MNIPLLFGISLGVCVIGVIVAFINIATGIQRTFKSGSPMSMIIVHIIAALMYVLGGFGAIGFGIAWICTYLKH